MATPKYTAPSFRSMGISPTEQAEWAALGCTNLEIITNLRLMGYTPDLLIHRVPAHVRATFQFDLKYSKKWSSCDASGFASALKQIRKEDGERVLTADDRADILMKTYMGPNGEEDGDETEATYQPEDRFYPEAKYALPPVRA